MRAAIVATLLIRSGIPEVMSSNSRVKFTDATESSGIAFRHATSKTTVKFLPETMGGGVAIFDADGDGRLDLYFTSGAARSSRSSTTAAVLNPRFARQLQAIDPPAISASISESARPRQCAVSRCVGRAAACRR
jgi:hypothetical protein